METPNEKISETKNLDIQEVYQRFILEEFARKISFSKHKEQFVFKGGFVVSTLLGFDTRMTRDIDVTYKSIVYSKEEVETIIKS
ncbi:nucleotidyl transferase AbiEii/AbiGii toxin family protein [Erysipelothrix urinaevulpis]|uniref:nucleotidyl transferase AbiEii/AbiGii toxin family protein n=1 Tax=Erysipelothrix urinaevulpis TaxID=2683717 RepID=UPI00135CCF0F|nr:nucleotidyl transferase AbiEii/AbiGii toxin family protein [Erysipelothrix urinaevulpis]